MLYPIVLRCAAPSDLAAIHALDPGTDLAALGASIESGRYLVAQHRDRLVAGARWQPGDAGATVRLTFALPELADHEVVARLLWYAETAALLAGLVAQPEAAPRASLAVVVAEAAQAPSTRHLAA